MPAGLRFMLPDRSSMISTSGWMELKRAVSSAHNPCEGARMHAIRSRAAAKRFRRVMLLSYLDMVEISMGPKPTSTSTVTLVLNAVFLPVTVVLYRVCPHLCAPPMAYPLSCRVEGPAGGTIGWAIEYCDVES